MTDTEAGAEAGSGTGADVHTEGLGSAAETPHHAIATPRAASPTQASTSHEPKRIVVIGHQDVIDVTHDPETFSNAVSRFLQVPNGLDGEEHAAARALLDPFLTVDRVNALEPALHRIADDVIEGLQDRESFDAVTDLGARFAVRAQSEWLGWRKDLEDELLDWVEANRASTRSGDLAEITRVARAFNLIIRSLLDERRETPTNDVTSELLELRKRDGHLLTEEEIISVLRNWTGGDLTSLALCSGVVVHWLATHPDEQERLREASAAGRGVELDASIDEMLRIDDPFVSNRRVATREAEVVGCPVHAGDVVVLDWRTANRDKRVFADPDIFDPETNRPNNLVYGTGVHVCPGRELATRELRVLTQRLLAAGRIVLDPDDAPVREMPPVAGFRRVPVRLGV